MKFHPHKNHTMKTRHNILEEQLRQNFCNTEVQNVTVRTSSSFCWQVSAVAGPSDPRPY